MSPLAWPSCFWAQRSSTSADEASPARSEWPANRFSRSCSDRLPRTPAAKSCALDQTRHFLIVEPIRPGFFSLAVDTAKQRTFGAFRKLNPGLNGDDGAGGIGGTAADLDLAPAGLAVQGDQQTFVEDFDPATTVPFLVTAEVEAGDFGSTETTGKTDKQPGPVADTGQAPPLSSVSSMAIRSSGSKASFCRGGAACVLRMPAMMWRWPYPCGRASCRAGLRSSQWPRDAARWSRRCSDFAPRSAAPDAQAVTYRPTTCGSGEGGDILAPAPGGKCFQSLAWARRVLAEPRGLDVTAGAIGQTLQVSREGRVLWRTNLLRGNITRNRRAV